MNVPVNDLVALCVNSSHEKFGELGKITFHDWKDSGRIGVVFKDGKELVFSDGLLKGENVYIERYYRSNNGIGKFWDEKSKSGPKELKKRFLYINKNWKKLQDDYGAIFGEQIDISFSDKVRCFLYNLI